MLVGWQFLCQDIGGRLPRCQRNMRQPPTKNAQTLNSWKEIASYLGRGVRTVQRWESELQLPVHRMGRSERSPVFAFPRELDIWLRRQAGVERYSHNVAPNATEPDCWKNRLSNLNRSARLASRAMQLINVQQAHTRSIAEQLERMAHLVPTIGKLRTSFPAFGDEPVSPITSRRSLSARTGG
jgi:hypothetical protein